MAINDYCTIAEVKAAIPDETWGSKYDVILPTLAKSASRLIDRHMGKKPGAFYVDADVTCYFDGSGTSELKIGELAAAPTSVAVSETGSLTAYTTWLATDYILYPLNALDAGRPYTKLVIDKLNGSKVVWYAYRKAVKIVGKFGFSTTVPDDLKQVAIIQTFRWWKRGQQAFQDTGAITELGQLTYTKALDPDLVALLPKLRGSPL